MEGNRHWNGKPFWYPLFWSKILTNIIHFEGVHCVSFTPVICITSKYTYLNQCYSVGDSFRGGANTMVLERFMVWKNNEKITDKTKPMPKVWDKNMQWSDWPTQEVGYLGIRRLLHPNSNGGINLWDHHTPSYWRWSPWLSTDSPIRLIWLV